VQRKQEETAAACGQEEEAVVSGLDCGCYALLILGMSLLDDLLGGATRGRNA
jgi:hypothetical protein